MCVCFMAKGQLSDCGQSSCKSPFKKKKFLWLSGEKKAEEAGGMEALDLQLLALRMEMALCQRGRKSELRVAGS